MFIYILVLLSLLGDIAWLTIEYDDIYSVAMEISVNYSQKYLNQPMPMLVILTRTMTSSPSNEKRPTKVFLHYTGVY